MKKLISIIWFLSLCQSIVVSQEYDYPIYRRSNKPPPPKIVSNQYPIIELDQMDLINTLIPNIYPSLKFEVLNKNNKEIEADLQYWEVDNIFSSITGDSLLLRLKYQNKTKLYFVMPVVDSFNYQESQKRYKQYLDELNSNNSKVELKRKQRESYLNSLSPEERIKESVVEICSTSVCQLLRYFIWDDLKFMPMNRNKCKNNEKYVHFYNLSEEPINDSLIILVNVTHKLAEIYDKYSICIEQGIEYRLFFINGNTLYYNRKDEYKKLLTPNKESYNIIMESCNFSKEAVKKILESK